MIIIPFVPYRSLEPEECPHCHKPEHKKEVCCHCGYEYPEDDASISGLCILIVIFLLITAMWIIITIMTWLFGIDHRSLLEVLYEQWLWLISIRIW